MNNSTYYQRNREIILNRAKDYYENDKERLREQEEINIETYPMKIKRKRENVEKIDIIVCLKKKKLKKRIWEKQIP